MYEQSLKVFKQGPYELGGLLVWNSVQDEF